MSRIAIFLCACLSSSKSTATPTIFYALVSMIAFCMDHEPGLNY